jgi:transcriptional regulator with XRE-family HTH domain
MVLKVPYGPRSCQVAETDGMKVRRLRSLQIRAARALLRWSADDLARESALGINTIKRAELAENETSLTVANDLAVRRALETAGVIFIDEDGSAGPGVRLRKPQRKSV